MYNSVRQFCAIWGICAAQEPDVRGFGRHMIDERGADRDHRAKYLATLERRRGNSLGESMAEPEEAAVRAERPRLVDHRVPVDLLDGALADVFP